MKIKISYCIALFMISCNGLFGSNIDYGIKQMGLSEKAALHNFFEYSIECDSLGYVLFFENKPACSIGCSSLQQGYQKFLKGWNVWKKYENFFSHPNFIFCNEKIFHSEGCQIINLYIINKKSLLKCLSNNEIVFNVFLGENFSKEEFIRLLENTKDLDQAIQNNELLRGIILGFGEESASAFYEHHIFLTNDAIPPWTDTYCGVGDYQHCRIYPVGFMGNPHSEEVKKLLDRYREEREEIHKRFCCSRHKLQVVLEALCQP